MKLVKEVIIDIGGFEGLQNEYIRSPRRFTCSITYMRTLKKSDTFAQ